MRLPGTGWVKRRPSRAIEGDIREATVWRTALGCRLDSGMPDNGLTVGVDRGVAVPLMLSDGTASMQPPEIERHERRTRVARRLASRRKRASRRWATAQKRVADLWARWARGASPGRTSPPRTSPVAPVASWSRGCEQHDT